MVDARIAEVAGGVRIDIDGRAVGWQGEALAASGDVALCSALLPGMISQAAQLSVDAPATRELVGNTASLQDIFAAWLPGSRRVVIDVAEQPSAGGPLRETACFFSGGVDSFHAVVSARDRIDRLVYVEGFDVRAQQQALQRETRAALEQAAAWLGLPLTVLRTDVREWSDDHLSWGMYHGAALATAAHLVARTIKQMIIPSSAPYDQLYPWGSHPLTDPLWSGSVQIEHYGATHDRFQKIATILDEEAARRTLRVCWRNPDQAYNCGRCEKCLRTMTTLAAYGVLERFETFPDTLTVRAVSGLRLRGQAAQRNARRNIDLLARNGVRPDLQRAWQGVLDGPSAGHRALSRGLAMGRRGKRSLRRFVR
jgi:hypothetical protein